MSFLLRKTVCQTLVGRTGPNRLPINLLPLFRYSTGSGKDTGKDGEVDGEHYSDAEDNAKLGGFAKAYIRQSTAHLDTEPKPAAPTQSFATMLRNSKFIDVSRHIAVRPVGEPDAHINQWQFISDGRFE